MAAGSRSVKFKAFAGLRNDVAPERFTPGDLVVANNVNIGKAGDVSRRAGYTLRSATPAHSLWAHGALGLFVSGTQLMRLESNYAATPLRTVSGAVMSYCQTGERTYFSDGASSGVYEGAATRSWGLTVPATPAATVLGGDLTAGTYQFTVTHLRSDGQESGAAVAGTIVVPSGSTLRLALTAPLDPSVVSQLIYLSPPNGDALYLTATLAAAAASFTASAATVAALALPLATQFLGPPPAGQLVAYYRGRMFVAVGAVVYMSEPFAYELFDLRNYIELDATVTLLAPMEDRQAPGLFVGTTKTCGVLLGAGPDDFTYIAKVDYGAIPGTLTYADGTLIDDGKMGARQLPMWTTTQGVCIGTPLMEIANHTLGRYDFMPSGTGAGLFIPEANRYVAVTTTSTTAMRGESSAMTAYTGFNFTSFAVFNGAYLGTKTGGIYELVGATDAGAAIVATLLTGITDFSSPLIKSLERLYVGYWASADLALTVAADEAAPITYALPAVNAAGLLHGSRVKTGKGLAGRYWQFGLSNTAGADFALDVLEVDPFDRQRRAHA